ncbi:MAG TPA: hypothetical protein VD866_03695 [Urbifossiella sp.]|nr:hypothetical protein [Urbifossiella sp.]
MRRTLLIMPFLAVAAQPAGFGEPHVTYLAFSPDGKSLTATYYRHAINRPGTDWGSFGVTWDIATGRAMTLQNAIGSVAYSPDGKLLATGLVERSREPGFRNRPYVRLALWTPGEAKPATVLTAPTDPGPTAAGQRASDKGSVVAFAFHPGGKHVAVASVDQLWWHTLGGNAVPLADLKLAPMPWRNTAALVIEDDAKVLRLTTPPVSGRGKATVVRWRVEVAEKGATYTEMSREEKDVPPWEREVTAVSPDGAMKASATGVGVTVVDAKTGQKLKEFRPGK